MNRRRLCWSLLIVGVSAACGITACNARGQPPPVPIAGSVWEFTLDDISGQPHDFARHRGKVLLIVNVASKCGYTGQYAALQALHERYHERGLVVIGVPANDFLWQESGSNEQIARFCSTTYGVTFPMMAKVAVTGDDRHPLYWYLTRDSARPGRIGWNFTKFLIGRDGTVVGRFAPSVAPEAPEIARALEQALAATPPAP